MRTALLATLILLGPLAACGEDGERGADAAADRHRAGLAAAGAPETATPHGLAAAVIAHLDDGSVRTVGGGLTDMEDQRYVAVDLRLAGARNQLHIEAEDPTFLPGDGGIEKCPHESESEGREGTLTCATLPDGTVIEVYWVGEGMSDGNDHGATAIAYVDGPSRSIQLTYESFDRATALTADTIAAIAEDPLVGWTTSSATNAAGERIEGFQAHGRVDRDGEEGYDESTPDVHPAP